MERDRWAVRRSCGSTLVEPGGTAGQASSGAWCLCTATHAPHDRRCSLYGEHAADVFPLVFIPVSWCSFIHPVVFISVASCRARSAWWWPDPVIGGPGPIGRDWLRQAGVSTTSTCQDKCPPSSLKLLGFACFGVLDSILFPFSSSSEVRSIWLL
jgi:hypothetical protein